MSLGEVKAMQMNNAGDVLGNPRSSEQGHIGGLKDLGT